MGNQGVQVYRRQRHRIFHAVYRNFPMLITDLMLGLLFKENEFLNMPVTYLVIG